MIQHRLPGNGPQIDIGGGVGTMFFRMALVF